MYQVLHTHVHTHTCVHTQLRKQANKRANLKSQEQNLLAIKLLHETRRMRPRPHGRKYRRICIFFIVWNFQPRKSSYLLFQESLALWLRTNCVSFSSVSAAGQRVNLLSWGASRHSPDLRHTLAPPSQVRLTSMSRCRGALVFFWAKCSFSFYIFCHFLNWLIFYES